MKSQSSRAPLLSWAGSGNEAIQGVKEPLGGALLAYIDLLSGMRPHFSDDPAFLPSLYPLCHSRDKLSRPFPAFMYCKSTFSTKFIGLCLLQDWEALVSLLLDEKCGVVLTNEEEGR